MRLFRFFARHPLISNSFSYGTLFAAGEFSQQTLTRSHLVKKSSDEGIKYDFEAVARYFVIGTFLVAPGYFFWYRWLDKRFIGKDFKTIVSKLALDQMILAPTVLITFFTAMGLLEGKPVLDDLQKKFPKTYLASCLYWLPAQTINFSFVRSEYRVVTIGCFSFIWVNMLSYLKQNVMIFNVKF